MASHLRNSKADDLLLDNGYDNLGVLDLDEMFWKPIHSM
jgi:hypothetical protein